MPRNVNATSKNFQGIMDGSYSIPDYQRLYVWDNKTIKKLLNDLMEHSIAYPRDANSPYYLGSVMVIDDGGNKITDGQQRFTCLTGIACALRDILLVNGQYALAWELHSNLLSDITTTVDRLGLYQSNDDAGTDSQIWWAMKPKSCNLKVRMRLENGPDRLVTSDGSDINIPWDSCIAVTGSGPNRKKIEISGEPTVPDSGFDVTSALPANVPTNDRIWYLSPRGAKTTKGIITGKYGNNVDWNEWKGIKKRAVQTYNIACQFIARKAKERAIEAGNMARTRAAAAGMNLAQQETAAKTGALGAKIDFLTSMKEHMYWLDFSVAEFTDADHAIEYFRIFNDVTTRVPLNPGDELNAWVNTVLKTTFTDPSAGGGPNGVNQRKRRIDGLWTDIKTLLRPVGSNDYLGDFMCHYLIATNAQVTMKGTFSKFDQLYLSPKQNGARRGIRKTWNLTDIEAFLRKLKVAAEEYKQIVLPENADTFGSRFAALKSTSFRQYPPIMLAGMIACRNLGIAGNQRRSMIGYLLAVLETLYFRGVVLTKYPLGAPTGQNPVRGNEIYNTIPTWSLNLLGATNENALEVVIDTIKTAILVYCNRNGTKLAWQVTPGVMQPHLAELQIVRESRNGNISPVTGEMTMMLMRIDAWMQGSCSAGNTNRLVYQTNTDLSLEHILPQNPDPFPWGGYANKTAVNDDVHKIGNLVTLPLEDNRNLSNGAIDVKFDTHANSNYVDVLAACPKNKLLNDAITRGGPVGTRDWTPTTISDRGTDMAANLFLCFGDAILTRTRW